MLDRTRSPGAGRRLLPLVALTMLSAAAFAAPQETAPPVPAGLAGPAVGQPLATWAADWIEGPVGVIATGEEKELFAGLETTRERLQFIRLFWERRDPRLRGPRNEYLDEFGRRLAWIDERFSTEREAGWTTLFGRIALLFGIPDRERRELSVRGGISDRPPILWSYDAQIQGLEANEDLMFVFRGGRWRLAPQSGFGDTGVSEAIRDLERQSLLVDIPSEYQRAMDRAIEEDLANSVDYRQAIDTVRTTVRAPESDIPFSWTPVIGADGGAGHPVTLRLTFRMDTLVFQLVDGEFRTDMTVEAQLLEADGEPVAVGGTRIEVVVPEAVMDAQRDEIVAHELTFDRPLAAGSYRLEVVLLDAFLGYRTTYEGAIEVGS